MAEQNYYDSPPAEQRRQQEKADRNSRNETAGIPQPLKRPLYRPKKSKASARMTRT